MRFIHFASRLLLLLLLSLSFKILLAQDYHEEAVSRSRQEVKQLDKDTLIVSLGPVITSLSQFNGWIKQTNGKWTSSPNRIPFENPEHNNPLYARYKTGTENINNITIQEVRVNNKKYFVVFVEQTKAFLKDSVNYEWKYYTAADYYVVRPEELKHLWPDSLVFNKKYTVNIEASYAGLIGYKDISLRPKFLASEMNVTEKNRLYYDTSVHKFLQLLVYPVKNKKGVHVRFNTALAYATTGKKPAQGDYSIFDNQFYETQFQHFKQFARLQKPAPQPAAVNKKSR